MGRTRSGVPRQFVDAGVATLDYKGARRLDVEGIDRHRIAGLGKGASTLVPSFAKPIAVVVQSNGGVAAVLESIEIKAIAGRHNEQSGQGIAAVGNALSIVHGQTLGLAIDRVLGHVGRQDQVLQHEAFALAADQNGAFVALSTTRHGSGIVGIDSAVVVIDLVIQDSKGSVATTLGGESGSWIFAAPEKAASVPHEEISSSVGLEKGGGSAGAFAGSLAGRVGKVELTVSKHSRKKAGSFAGKLAWECTRKVARGKAGCTTDARSAARGLAVPCGKFARKEARFAAQAWNVAGGSADTGSLAGRRTDAWGGAQSGRKTRAWCSRRGFCLWDSTS